MICSLRLQRTACSHSYSCAETVVLGLTGELFAVALLVLSIVPAVLTTDSTTMEIKME